MRHFFSLLSGASVVIGLGSFQSAQAQSLVSGFMAGKGHGSVVVSGTTEHYNSVYLAPDKIDAVPVFRQVRVNSVNLYATYGITDKIDAIVSLPYIQAKGKADGGVINDLDNLYSTAGYANTRQGFQDVTGLLKFKAYSVELGSNTLDLLGVASVSTPISNYQTNTGYGYIIAIGNRATKVSTAGVAHLKTSSGVFLTGQAGYSLRNNQVPNAFLGEAKIGYAGPKTYLEGFVAIQESHGGTDISEQGFSGFFPATRVNFVRVGGSLYRPIAKGVGLILGASTYVAGRNIGKATGYSAGVSYNF